jgi:hypothetical protein
VSPIAHLHVQADGVDQDDEDYDAAEIDRELIASRLQHDVVSPLLHNQVRR